MRERVRFEYRLEFALEGHHFFNLVRWGIVEETLNEYFKTEKEIISYLNDVNFVENDRYFAILLTEIERSYKDGKPTLIQTPGY